jgi:protein involved in polysaccharide export with SLBB domain
MSINQVGKVSGFWVAIGALLLAGILAGCGSHSPKPGDGSGPGQGGSPAGGSAETIQVGDDLLISFSDLPDPKQPFEDKVKSDGTILLMQNQTFTVTNMTTGELEKDIRARYVPAFYKNMTVTVSYAGQTRFYYVGGEVRAPGRQIYTGPITVIKAIDTAGGFTDFAKKTKVELTRVNGHVEYINCNKVLKDPRLDPQVFPGDKIHVARRVWM